ncbi:hypothetical protein Tco_0776968 [Tanacetum coccineum]
MMKKDEKLRKDDISIWWSLKMKFERYAATSCRTAAIRPRDHDDHQDDAHPKGENNDDEVPNEEVSQDLWEDISGEVEETQLQKVVNDLLRH